MFVTSRSSPWKLEQDAALPPEMEAQFKKKARNGFKVNGKVFEQMITDVT